MRGDQWYFRRCDDSFSSNGERIYHGSNRTKSIACRLVEHADVWYNVRRNQTKEGVSRDRNESQS